MTSTNILPSHREAERHSWTSRIAIASLLTAIALGSYQNAMAAEQPSDAGVADGIGSGNEQAASEKQQTIIRPRQLLLDVCVATMKPGCGSKLGTWQKVTLADDEIAVSPYARADRAGDNEPITAQVLTAADGTDTESLLRRARGLEKDKCLHIVSRPQLIVQDGDDALLITICQEWFLTPVLRTRSVFDGEGFPISRAISMTVHVNDSNDFTIGTAFEISNRGATQHQNDPDPEIFLRRTTTHSVTLKNGGTMVWVDLMQPEPKPERPSRVGFWSTIWAMLSRNPAARPAAIPNGETVILVTASLIPESPSVVTPARQ